jgi:hypothetical protein
MQLIIRAIIVSVTLSCIPVMADQKDDEIAKLKAQVEALVKENQQLRQLLAQQPPSQRAAAPTQVKDNNETKSGASVSEEKQSQECWITTSSSKRHNPTCRYYKTSKGRACTKAEGIPCKICGG